MGKELLSGHAIPRVVDVFCKLQSCRFSWFGLWSVSCNPLADCGTSEDLHPAGDFQFVPRGKDWHIEGLRVSVDRIPTRTTKIRQIHGMLCEPVHIWRALRWQPHADPSLDDSVIIGGPCAASSVGCTARCITLVASDGRPLDTLIGKRQIPPRAGCNITAVAV